MACILYCYLKHSYILLSSFEHNNVILSVIGGPVTLLPSCNMQCDIFFLWYYYTYRLLYGPDGTLRLRYYTFGEYNYIVLQCSRFIHCYEIRKQSVGCRNRKKIYGLFTYYMFVRNFRTQHRILKYRQVYYTWNYFHCLLLYNILLYNSTGSWRIDYFSNSQNIIIS